MDRIGCPVCGETLAELAAGPCPACGALLSEALLAELQTRAEPAETTPPVRTGPALTEAETDELITAFRSQFERHELAMPRRWVERLRYLATHVEVSQRQATVIFVDLRGYTSLSQLLSTEQLDQLRQWFYGVCTRQIEQHGGFVIQFLGDAAFAGFGAPWAFERDAESAIQAILAIREEVRRLGNFEGHDLAIRAGADTGTVSVRLTEVQGRPAPDLFGSTVNLAARLEAAAATWEVLISDTLADQVRGVFEMEPREPFLPKNYGRMVSPWAVARHLGAEAQRRRHDTAFVGRASERAALETWIGRVERGEFVAAQLQGVAGVGKSRLAREGLAAAGDRLRLAWTDCASQERHGLLRPILRGLEQAVDWVRPGDGRGSPEERLTALAEVLPDNEKVLIPSLGYALGVEPHLTRLKGLPGAALRQQIVIGLSAALASLDRTRARAFVVDDQQWIDPLSREVLDRLARLRPPGLLLLAIGRPPEPSAEAPTWEAETAEAEPAAEPPPVWEELAVGPLAEADVPALLSQIVDLERLHPLVRRRLAAESEAIPLYLIELARKAGEEWTDLDAEGLARLQSPEARERLPSTIVEILQTRLDQLDAQRRALLQCASVLGDRFSLSLIELFQAVKEDLLAELYALKGLRFLRDQPLPEDIGFEFTPSVLRDLAYQMMTAEQRQRLHRTIALRIEQRFGDRLEQFALDLASHWLYAGEPTRARIHLRRGAQQAMLCGAPQAAYQLLSRALGAQAAPGEAAVQEMVNLQQRALLSEMAARACRLMGDFPRSDAHLADFAELADRLEHPLWRAEARLQQAINALEQGEAAAAEERAEPLDRGEDLPPKLRLRLLNVRGIIRLRTGRFAEAEAEFETAIGLAPEAEAALRADALNNLGLTFWEQGRLERAREAFAGAFEVWSRMGGSFGQALTLNNVGIIEEKLGRIAEAAMTYDRAAGLAEEIGYLHGLGAVEANRANLALLRRDWRGAETAAARSLHLAQLIRHKHSEAIALENLGLARAGLGHLEEALSALRQAIAIGDLIEDPVRRDSARLASVWVALLSGQTERARRLFQALPAQVAPDLVLWRETLDLALTALASGDADGLFDEAALERLRAEASLENYLRRLDALVVLTGAGLAPDRHEALARRREAACPGAADAGRRK